MSILRTPTLSTRPAASPDRAAKSRHYSGMSRRDLSKTAASRWRLRAYGSIPRLCGGTSQTCTKSTATPGRSLSAGPGAHAGEAMKPFGSSGLRRPAVAFCLHRLLQIRSSLPDRHCGSARTEGKAVRSDRRRLAPDNLRHKPCRSLHRTAPRILAGIHHNRDV